MRLIKIFIISLLVPLLMFNLCLPGVSLAGTPTEYDQPESLSTPEQDIPVEKVKVKGSKTWLWVLIALAGGGAAAAAGGGGGGGGDSASTSSGGNTGSGEITW